MPDPTPSSSLLDALRNTGAQVLTDASDTAPFLIDWRKRYRGQAQAVVCPANTEQCAAVVTICAQAGVPIVPQGGNTGLVGGSVPDAQGRSVVISLRRMNQILAIDTINATITAQAGVPLQALQEAAEQAGMLFPLSLASEGSCVLGGNLSTNAGGTGVLRYGNTRELTLGLEVVLPDGRIWHGLRGLRKNNTGYDLKHLFVGAEGTLGIITAATMKLVPQPAAQVTAWVALTTLDDALALQQMAALRLGSALTAFEIASAVCIRLVLKHFPDCRQPLALPELDGQADEQAWYVLIESSDSESEAHAQQRFEALMEEAFEAGLITDATIAASLAQSQAFWSIRENISEAQACEGKNIKHDIAVPISAIPEFVHQTNALLAQAFASIRMVIFGHVGDGNLHYNVSPPIGQDHDAFLANQDAINLIVHDQVHRFNGSISAEHGLGALKRFENVRYKDPVELDVMRAVKQALDPQGLMNPGKVLP